MFRIEIILALGLACATAAHAQATDEAEEFRALIEEQRRIVEQQQQFIDRQRADSDEQRAEIRELKHHVEALRIEAGQARFATDPVGETRSGPAAGLPSGAQYRMSVGGHVNRAVNIGYDGDGTKSYFVDNFTVPTLLFVKASTRVNDDLTVRGHVEPGFSDNASLFVNQKNESAGLFTAGRFFEVIAESEKYGTFYFGKGVASSLTLFELDQSGMQYASLLSVGNSAGGLLFYDKRTRALTDIQVNSVFLDIEGATFINRVRYDSPLWNGFRLSGTLGSGKYGDVTLRYFGEWGDFAVVSTASYQGNSFGGFADWRADGGVGILHQPTGLNLTVGASRTKLDNTGEISNGVLLDGHKNSGFIVRAGLRRNWIAAGETKLSVDYTLLKDTVTKSDTGTSIGAYVMQDVDILGMQLYSGFRTYSLRGLEGVNLDSIMVFSSGISADFESTWDF